MFVDLEIFGWLSRVLFDKRVNTIYKIYLT